MTRRTAWLVASALVAACVERGEVLKPSAEHPAAGTGGGSVGGSSGVGGGTPGTGDDGGGGGELVMPPPSLVVTSVAVGTSHSAAIAGGRLYTWGANEVGELGLGDTLERHTPTALAGSANFVSVTAGGAYTCALDELGAVYCFGANDRGQLGQGDRDERHAPVRVALRVAARAIANDFEHVCALLADASLYCWGRNQEGELGQNDRPPGTNDPDTAVDALAPVAVPGTDWRAIAAGDGASCGVRFDGSVWCWGRNSGHQLGPSTDIQIRHPIQVGSDTDWLSVRTGQQFSLALKQDHSLWCWGTNVASGSGDGFPLGIDVDVVDTPTRIGDASDWVVVATRVFHTCAVNRANELWCWGRNLEGQLGTGDTTLRKTPTHVADDVVDVAASWFTTCALTQSGHVLCTGKNEHGELGDGTTDRPLRFTDVTPTAD